MIEVRVDVARGSYPVYIGGGIFSEIRSLVAKHCNASTYAIITDSTVSQHYASDVAQQIEQLGSCQIFEFAAGESHKTRHTWSDLTDRMIEAGIGRDAVIVALGGGVVGDVAGFVAATYHRGIDYIQIPTSLLAMVDSSVGGKTGVDTSLGKNLVGALHQPRLVIADTATLGTLPDSHMTAGMAEALKHGAVADANYFHQLRTNRAAIFAREQNALEVLVRRSVEIKADVVGFDERELGKRAILNFGHTVGHAIEAVSDFSIVHGAAVAIGMVIESRLGERLEITRPGTADTLTAAFTSFGLPVTLPPGQSADKILAAMRRDKKNRSGSIRFSAIESLGNMVRTKTDSWTFELSDELLRTVLSRKDLS